MNNTISHCRCMECGVEFEQDEEMFSWESGWVCAECFEALFSELDRYERARLMGCRIMNYRRPKRAPV